MNTNALFQCKQKLLAESSQLTFKAAQIKWVVWSYYGCQNVQQEETKQQVCFYQVRSNLQGHDCMTFLWPFLWAEQSPVRGCVQPQRHRHLSLPVSLKVNVLVLSLSRHACFMNTGHYLSIVSTHFNTYYPYPVPLSHFSSPIQIQNKFQQWKCFSVNHVVFQPLFCKSI